MAALIASPINTSHRMSCILMEKLKKKKKKHLKGSLCCVLFQFVYTMHLKKYRKGEKKLAFLPPQKR